MKILSNSFVRVFRVLCGLANLSVPRQISAAVHHAHFAVDIATTRSLLDHRLWVALGGRFVIRAAGNKSKGQDADKDGQYAREHFAMSIWVSGRRATH